MSQRKIDDVPRMSMFTRYESEKIKGMVLSLGNVTKRLLPADQGAFDFEKKRPSSVLAPPTCAETNKNRKRFEPSG